ncbi:MAG: glutamine synthetase family protein [Pseudomonadota bacterium]|nr:glutamine synthetase family protein [Pseudomonadota bacterium]
MSKENIFHDWFAEHKIEDLEVLVPDMAGAARGKMIPASSFGEGVMKMPEAIFGQTFTGNYYESDENIEDRDMLLVPDPETICPVPWMELPTASVIFDGYTKDGQEVQASPRRVLQNVLKLYKEQGWEPVVAPEAEFYLLNPSTDFNVEVEPPQGRLGRTDTTKQPYSLDAMNNFDPFINQVYEFSEVQGISIDNLSQEMGPSQLEINFVHGDALSLADQVFRFKRTVREAAILHGMHATFMARPITGEAGSAMHIHQSIMHEDGTNIFTNKNGSENEKFMHYIGGLQRYMPEALLIFAPYANSYRRFLSYWSSPVNLEWAVDNRSVGLRIPDCEPANRRVENRLGGSDVNPYLVLAATLACGYLGMMEKLSPRDAIEGSAYELPFGLHRHMYVSIDTFSSSSAMRKVLGDSFVDMYTGIKQKEYEQFQEIITPWEREHLMLNV